MLDSGISQSINNLWSWLQTWTDDKGGIHGYVVHHHHDNLKVLSPDTWTQSPVILGLLNLCGKTGDKSWLTFATNLCDYLIENYIPLLHVYKNSNHEHKPLGKSEVIHNALPSYALLETSKQIDDKKKQEKYIKVAQDNIDNFILDRWNDVTGALYNIYHGERAHIHNMNSSALLALCSLNDATADSKYLKYADSIANYIIKCQVDRGPDKGAYPYADLDTNYRTLYSLITTIGLAVLYHKLKKNKLLNSVEKSIRHLENFIDLDSGLICHFHHKGFPQWVPDTFLYLMNAKWLEMEGTKLSLDLDQRLESLLKKQYSNGGFPLSIGFEDLWHKKGLPSKPFLKRWRDLLPTPNWNAWNFWAMSELVPNKIKIMKPNTNFPLEILTDKEDEVGSLRIVEEKDRTIFYNKKGKILGIFNKKSEIADLCLVTERSDNWILIDSLKKYPEMLQRIIMKMAYLK